MKQYQCSWVYDQVIKFQFIDSELSMKLEDGKKVNLKDIDQYVGYKDEGEGANMDFYLKTIIFTL